MSKSEVIIYSSIRENIYQYYTKENADPFIDLFYDSEFGHLLELPLFRRSNFDDLSDQAGIEDASAFKIINEEEHAAPIKFDLKLNNSLSLEEAFKLFCTITHNVITAGDFRKNPKILGKDLQGMEYFLHQGDGYCTSLAFMLETFIRKYTDSEIECGYCRSNDGGYTHAYNHHNETLVDAALKEHNSYETIQKKPPIGWFYTLIKRVGMLFYEEMGEDINWVFDSYIHDELNFMLSGNHQLVYRSDAELKNIHTQFLDTFHNHSVDMSLELDDFDWKKVYRICTEQWTNQSEYRFFADLEKGATFELPPNSILRTPRYDNDRLSRIIEEIFYGRVLLELDLKLKEGEVISLEKLPSPYLISTTSINSLMIDDQNFEFNSFQNDKKKYLGLKAIGRTPKRISSRNDCEITLHIPFNLLLLNSPYLQLNTDCKLEARK